MKIATNPTFLKAGGLLVLGWTLAGCATSGGMPGHETAAADHFVYELNSPRVRIRIPELPPIPMGPHPMARAGKNHLRAYGTKDRYAASVMTPTADRGMSSQQCANSTAAWLIRRHGLQKKDYLVFKGANPETYGFIYAQKTPVGPRLVTYLISSYEGTHCIDVHLSLMATGKEEVRRWAQGFPGATIDKY